MPLSALSYTVYGIGYWNTASGTISGHDVNETNSVVVPAASNNNYKMMLCKFYKLVIGLA